MNKLILVLPVSLMLAAAAFAQSATMTPAQGIAAAAANPDKGADGTFEFVVQSVGEVKAAQGVIVYLNSEVDYRSATNISAAIMPLTAKSLEKTVGGSLKQNLVGKRVAISGTAKQTRIDFFDEVTKKKTNAYYFQTRISVKGADQIKVF